MTNTIKSAVLALVRFAILWEVGRELWEAWQQKRRNVQPRLNRLAHGYPFLRAAMCTPMRDISANIAILDMMRGAPSMCAVDALLSAGC